MNHTTQAKRAEALRQMHDRRNILLLPNAWDAGSARLFATRGFRAIATTSGGVAWALGYADGEQELPESTLKMAHLGTARYARWKTPPHVSVLHAKQRHRLVCRW